jgi:hypothetical protein
MITSSIYRNSFGDQNPDADLGQMSEERAEDLPGRSDHFEIVTAFG